LPYIPGKRLKGCLRECGLDIISVDERYADAFDALFGETGKLVPGALTVGNGQLENYDGLALENGAAHRSELAEICTSVRSRTKMEEGKYAPGTLRTVRVLNKGQVYEFPVSLTDDTLDLFNMCVKSLRSMGLNRSRGLGEVVCSLTDGAAQSGEAFHISDCLGQKSFSYEIRLTEPVISAERNGKPLGCEDYIFGSAVLGAFAARYFEKTGLPRAEAYKDPDFRRIFLDGAVKFTAAMPSKDGNTYYPAPAMLKTNKLATVLSDESDGIPPVEADAENPICRRLGGFVSFDGNVVRHHKPQKLTFIHHARPADKGKGHAAGAEDRADKAGGEMFTYEALAPGQTFAGSVIGSGDDLRLLSGLFTEDNILRIGRSRTAQYGKAEIRSASVNAQMNDMALNDGDKFRLVAITPVILEDANGINTTDLNVIKDTLGEDLAIVRYACSETTIAGYNGKWLLPRGQERAIAEGSVIVFKYNGSGARLQVNFIGKRTGEGFGRIRLEPVPKADAFKFPESDATAAADTGQGLSQKVIELRAGKKAASEGAKYGESPQAPPKNANLHRLVSALNKSAGFAEFAQKLDDIKQPEQKIAALVFATGKDKWYFKTNAEHLKISHIENLLKQRGYDYKAYRIFLTNAAQKIKQKRRNNGENAPEGGDNDAK
jgi:CRISPR-associated protein Csx10